MKETAINSVYVILHCIGKTEDEVENKILLKEGNLWIVRFRKDKAEKDAERLNNLLPYKYELNGKTYYHKYVVFEKMIY